MADLIIVYWRDIPAQVIVRKGRQNAKRELPLRFTEAIDMCAMRTGAGDTDAYLAEWRKAEPVPVGDDLEAEADEGAGRDRREIRQGAAGRARQGRRQGKWLKHQAVTQATLVKKAAPKTDYKPADVSPQRRVQRSYTIRLWSVRHSRALEWFYARFADMFLLLHPLWKGIGYGRVEGAGEVHREARQGLHVRLPHVRPVRAVVDRHVVPDELPQAAAQRPLRRRARQRQLRGRARHALRLGQGLGRLANMVKGDAILNVQKPVDQSLRETSAWLRVTAQAAAAREKPRRERPA